MPRCELSYEDWRHTLSVDSVAPGEVATPRSRRGRRGASFVVDGGYMLVSPRSRPDDD